jgi:hypothetical protein
MLVTAALSLLLVPQLSQECTAASTAPALDHVVLVVRDLEAASAGFRSRGFKVKPGRLHANNLLNRHIKFRDQSSLELMTVRGTPRDAMARDYADLAAEEEGGVYVALTVSRIEGPKAAAAALALPTHESSSGPWRFLSFPPASPVAAVFFSVGSAIVQDPDSLVDHVPGVTGLSEAWLEGGAEVVSLLERLGAVRCRTVEAPDGRTGEQLALSRGRLVIVPPRAAGRPRVLGVVLGLQEDGGGTVHPHRGFWVRYEKQAGAPLARRR